MSPFKWTVIKKKKYIYSYDIHVLIVLNTLIVYSWTHNEFNVIAIEREKMKKNEEFLDYWWIQNSKWDFLLSNPLNYKYLIKTEREKERIQTPKIEL